MGSRIMKRSKGSSAGNGKLSVAETSPDNSGLAVPIGELSEPNLAVLLAGLQTMRDGNFSVRLPGSWTGMAGKLADTFNEIVTANQQIAQELKRAGQVVGKEGRTRERTRFHQSRGAWGDIEVPVHSLVEDLLWSPAHVT